MFYRTQCHVLQNIVLCFTEHSATFYNNNALIETATFVSLQTFIQIHLNICYAIVHCSEIIPEGISHLVESFLA
jgi:hypothetical protein